MSFSDTFDGYCVIHAPHVTPERREWFERELKRVGVHNYTVIEAKHVDTSDPRATKYRADNAVALLSLIDAQKSCIDLAGNRGWESVAIFEDDVIFRDSFEILWKEVEVEVKRSDWEMLNLFSARSELLYESPRKKTKLIPIGFNRLTHCVIVRANAYLKYLESLRYCEEMGFPADFIYEYFTGHCNGKLMATSKNLAGQKNSFKSSLQNVSSWNNPFGAGTHYGCFKSTGSLSGYCLIALIHSIKKKFRGLKQTFQITKKEKLISPIEVFHVPSDNIFFPIIFKSGCTSLKNSIVKRFCDVGDMGYPEMHLKGWHVKTCGQVVRRFFNTYADYEKFAKGKTMCMIVRDPYERILSGYFAVRDTRLKLYEDMQIKWVRILLKLCGRISFEKYVEIISRIPSAWADRNFIPQFDYCSEKLMRNVSKVYICKLEELEERWDTHPILQKYPKIKKLNRNKSFLAFENYKGILKKSRTFQNRYEKDITFYHL